MIEEILKAACKANGLTSIGANIFNPKSGDVTVYVHFGDDGCKGATAPTFEQALKGALDEMAEDLAQKPAA